MRFKHAVCWHRYLLVGKTIFETKSFYLILTATMPNKSAPNRCELFLLCGTTVRNSPMYRSWSLFIFLYQETLNVLLRREMNWFSSVWSQQLGF